MLYTTSGTTTCRTSYDFFASTFLRLRLLPMENSDDFSDELDEFEESQDDSNIKKKVRYERNLLLS